MKPKDINFRDYLPSDRVQVGKLRVQGQRHVEASNPQIWHMTEISREKLEEEIDKFAAGEGKKTS